MPKGEGAGGGGAAGRGGVAAVTRKRVNEEVGPALRFRCKGCRQLNSLPSRHRQHPSRTLPGRAL